MLRLQYTGRNIEDSKHACRYSTYVWVIIYAKLRVLMAGRAAHTSDSSKVIGLSALTFLDMYKERPRKQRREKKFGSELEDPHLLANAACWIFI